MLAFAIPTPLVHVHVRVVLVLLFSGMMSSPRIPYERPEHRGHCGGPQSRVRLPPSGQQILLPVNFEEEKVFHLDKFQATPSYLALLGSLRLAHFVLSQVAALYFVFFSFLFFFFFPGSLFRVAKSAK